MHLVSDIVQIWQGDEGSGELGARDLHADRHPGDLERFGVGCDGEVGAVELHIVRGQEGEAAHAVEDDAGDAEPLRRRRRPGEALVGDDADRRGVVRRQVALERRLELV